MAWSRKKKEPGQKVEFSHFMDPGLPCEICGDEADTVIVYGGVRAEYYCKYCTIVVTADWSSDDHSGG